MKFEDFWRANKDAYFDGEKSARKLWQLAQEAGREATLAEVLRGLRSENDSVQLRAIIAQVEALRSEAAPPGP